MGLDIPIGIMETNQLPYFVSNVPLLEQLTAKRLNAIVSCVRSSNLTPGVGYTYQKTSGGTSLVIKGGRGGELTKYPLDLTLVDAGSTYTGVFRPGHINGLLPSNYLELTGISKKANVTTYISLNCTFSNAAIQTAIFANTTSWTEGMPTSMNVPPTNVKILTHVVLNGMVYRILGAGNPWLTPSASFETDKTGTISPGQRGTDIWYTYSLTTIA